MEEAAVNRVHEALVRALGDEAAVAQLEGGWLAAPLWSEALARTCAARFPGVEMPRALQLLGRELGDGFLASPDGAALRESLALLSWERLFMLVVPLLSARLRQGFEVTWVPTPRGGRLRVSGPRVAPAEVTLGFIEAVALRLAPSPRVSLERVEALVMEIEVAPAR